MENQNALCGLTVYQKILLHINHVQPRQERFSMPFSLTQTGIASAVGASQNFISVTLTEMARDNLIEEKSAHVEGKSRRMKVYMLTAIGIKKAADLMSYIKNREVLCYNGVNIIPLTIEEILGIARNNRTPVNPCDIILQAERKGHFSIPPREKNTTSDGNRMDHRSRRVMKTPDKPVIDVIIDDIFRKVESEMRENKRKKK